MCVICQILNLVCSFTRRVWSVALQTSWVILWFSVISKWAYPPWSCCYHGVSYMVRAVSLFISTEKRTERRRLKVRKYSKRNGGNQYRESVMNIDSRGDTSVDIKACATLCIRIISAAKAEGIVPQGICFILSKTVNIILLPKTSYRSNHHTTCRVRNVLMTVSWVCLISSVKFSSTDLKFNNSSYVNLACYVEHFNFEWTVVTHCFI